MGRTKKLATHWPKGNRPYIAYRYHNTSTKPNQRSYHRRIRTHNKNKDQISFFSISQTYGSFKSSNLQWKAGQLIGGKWSMKQVAQLQKLYAFNGQQRQFIGMHQTVSHLLQAASKQLKRRGKLGIFIGHRNPLQLYKHQTSLEY